MRILIAAIYPYVFLLLYLIIPFDSYIRALPNILLIILVLAFPFTVKKADFRNLKSLPVILVCTLLVYLAFNSFFAGRFPEDFNIIKKVMIALGMAILYIPVLNLDPSSGHAEKIKRAIIFSSLAAIVFSIYNFVLITDATGSFALGNSPQVVESLLIDRLYLGLLSTFSILISFQSIKEKYHPNNNYHLANIVINLVFILLIASKLAGISLFVLLFIYQFYGQRRIWKVFLACIALGAGITLFFIMKNDGSEIKESGMTTKSSLAFIENSRTYELRAVVWECATRIIEAEGFTWTGDGFEGTNQKLLSCYNTQITDPHKREEFIHKEYNTHNQFLDFYLSAGFIALFLFVIFVAVSFLSVRKQFFPTAMLALLVIYCLMENMFHRQIGSYYIAFILIMLMTKEMPRENDNLKEI